MGPGLRREGESDEFLIHQISRACDEGTPQWRPRSTIRSSSASAALDRIYGERIERVVLFGSRARGDATEDSDYDIAVFLHDLTDRWREPDHIIPVVTDILVDDEAFIPLCLTGPAPTKNAHP